MKRITFILLLLPALAFGQVSNKLKWFVLSNGSGGSAPTPDPTPSDFYHTTITVSDGNANAFVLVPEDVDNPPAGGWPLIIHLNGDGTSNNTTNVVTEEPLNLP